MIFMLIYLVFIIGLIFCIFWSERKWSSREITNKYSYVQLLLILIPFLKNTVQIKQEDMSFF